MSLADVIIRFVSPEPPHHPEPFADEPFAPVYDYLPLGAGDYHDTEWILPGPRPDPVVFGVLLAQHEVYVGDPVIDWVCGCGVSWAGTALACWCCGRGAAW